MKASFQLFVANGLSNLLIADFRYYCNLKLYCKSFENLLRLVFAVEQRSFDTYHGSNMDSDISQV